MNIFDKFKLTNKVALITGASKGIGEAIAQGLGQAGAKVIINSRKQDALEAAAERLRTNGVQHVLPIAANAGHLEDIQRLLAQAQEAFGGVDILVNNAAVNPVFGPVEQTDAAAFDKIMDVNVKGPFELAKGVLPQMQARGGGVIINIGSIGGVSPEPFLGIYSVSKAALVMLTKVLAKEWGTHGIRVNAICPGLIQTKFSQALWGNEALLKHLLTQLPAGRIGTVDEIAGLALMLASDAGSYCTGAVFTADGGHTV